MQLFGLLTTFSVADVLQWASQDRSTGALVFRRTKREKRVHMVNGEIVACFSSDPLEFYGRYLLSQDYLDEGELLRALSYCRRGGQRLGEALSTLELLPEDLVKSTLRGQIEDAVCDLFLWKHGLFYLAQMELPDENLLPEPIHTVGVVMEGTRWIDEYNRIRSRVEHDNITLRAGPAWPGKQLEGLKKRIVGHVEPREQLGDFYRRIGGSYFRFLEATYELLSERILEIDEIGPQRDTTMENISLVDLMLEQAAEEGRVSFGDRLTVHLDMLERLYPWWTGNGVPGALSDVLRSFVASLDGQHQLGESLAEEAEAREEQLQWLLLQLKEGQLALLPRPRSELL